MTQFYHLGKHCAVLLAICQAESLFAQAQQLSGGAVLDAVTRCRSDVDDRQRLACYDRAVGVLASARETDGLVVLDRAQVRERQRAGFGLAGTRPDPATGAKLPEIETLDSTVTRIVAASPGRFKISLADGSVWRTIEAARIEPARGDTVHIRRGAIGSYLGSFNKARSIRVERVR